MHRDAAGAPLKGESGTVPRGTALCSTWQL